MYYHAAALKLYRTYNPIHTFSIYLPSPPRLSPQTKQVRDKIMEMEKGLEANLVMVGGRGGVGG